MNIICACSDSGSVGDDNDVTMIKCVYVCVQMWGVNKARDGHADTQVRQSPPTGGVFDLALEDYVADRGKHSEIRRTTSWVAGTLGEFAGQRCGSREV